jgi:hypothetical protein
MPLVVKVSYPDSTAGVPISVLAFGFRPNNVRSITKRGSSKYGDK